MKKLPVLLILIFIMGSIACKSPDDPPGNDNGNGETVTEYTTISFAANGGTGSMESQEIPEKTSALIKANEFSRIGYTFSGWAESSGGSKKYNDADDFLADEGTINVKLYALWTAKTYTVGFNNTGGTGGQTTEVTVTFNQPMPAVQVPSPIQFGDTFTGYWDAPADGKKYYNADGSSAAVWNKDESSPVTLYAQFDPIGIDDYCAPFAATAPVIDGSGDDPAWELAEWRSISYEWMYNPPYSHVKNAADFSGRFKIVWTEDRLYILAEITDDIKSITRQDTPYINPENDDCLELFINENGLGGMRDSYAETAHYFTYHMSFGEENVMDYIGGTSNTATSDPVYRIENGYIKRNSHLNYKIGNKNNENESNTYIWETEMKIHDSTYPQRSSPDREPMKLTEGKKMGFAVAYCDADAKNTREHFIGSMFIAGSTDNERNQAYQNASVYAKLYLVP